MLKSLLDPGGSATLIQQRSIPPGIQPTKATAMNMNTAAGIFPITQKVYLSDIYMPEFNKTYMLSSIWAYVFDAPSQYYYDVIAG